MDALTLRDSSYRRACEVSDGLLMAPEGDLQAGDHVAVYGVGPTSTLIAPPHPTFDGPPDESRLVRYAYMSEDGGVSAATLPTLPPTQGQATWEQLEPEAKWVLAWKSEDQGNAWTPAGACLASPRGLGSLSGLAVRMTVGIGKFPEWVPHAPPDSPTRGRLLTQVVSIEGEKVILADVPEGSVGLLCYDASPLIRGALPSGRFTCHQDLMFDGVGEQLSGNGARWGDGLFDGTELVFEGGRGLCLCGADTSLTRITLSQRDRFPALDVAAPSRSTATVDWLDGALLLIERRARLLQVRVDRVAGTGMAMLAGLAGYSQNANQCKMDQVRITGCTGHGVFVDGSDANASILSGIDVVGCDGWGVLDESLLGNTWVGPHVSANQLGAYSINAGSLLHPYSEAGVQETSFFGANVSVLGGTHGAFPGGPASRVGRSKLWMQMGPSSHRTLFGHHVPAYASLLRRYEGADFRVHRREHNGAIEDYASNAAYVARSHHGAHIRGWGLIEFPRGILLGPNTRLLVVDPQAWPPGSYAPSDVVLDAATGDRIEITAPFGIGPDRTPNYVYRVGDVVTQGGAAFVCSATEQSLGSRCAPASMQLVDGLQDGGVTWALWGADFPQTP